MVGVRPSDGRALVEEIDQKESRSCLSFRSPMKSDGSDEDIDAKGSSSGS